MRVFRILMRAGPSGLAAGEIAGRLQLGASNISFHVAQLERAGLLRSWRVHRNIYYAVEIAGMQQLLSFLTDECCDGHPELCGVLAPTPVADMPEPAEG